MWRRDGSKGPILGVYDDDDDDELCIWVDWTDIFKISKLVYGERVIVKVCMETYINSQFMAGRVTWQDGCLSVSKLKAWGTFWNN